ncbi:ring finger domain containing protein [Nitzschia inconspicua]|uniref:RING-type E3 ubiquitin transferase n=1 Tax=Nitzschia inconspicua TaxID=303405 RepID=A0A9K3Q5N2_9STRA|nr:ring finger domain containing protein [Nitzschia inconspicua]
MAPPPSSQEKLMPGNRRCWRRRNERYDHAHPIVIRFGDRSVPRFLISVAVALFLVSVIVQPVSGEWYAQICPTGSVEAVAIDTATNRLIFVNHNLGGGGTTTSSSHNNTNNNNTNDDEYTPPSVVLVDDNNNNRNVFNSSSPATENANGAATSIPSHYDDKHQNRSFLRRSLQQISSFLLISQTQLEEQYEQSPALKISLSNEQDHGRILQNDNAIGDGGIDGDMDGTVSNFTVDNYRDGEIFFIRPCLCYNGRNRFSSSSSSSPSGTTTTASSSTADELHLCNADASYCGVPVDGTMPVACYSVKMQQVVARNAWPLILLWYFGLSVICLCTIHGHTAGECVKSCLLPHYNERFLDRMLNSNNNNNNPRNDDTRRYNWWSWQRHRFEQNLMLQVQWIWRHEEYNRERRRRQQGLPAPQLELKVKRWTNNHNNHHHSTDWTEGGDDSISEDAAATPLVSIELGSIVPTSGDAPSRSEQEVETSLNDNEPIAITEDSNGTTIDLEDTSRNEGGSCSPDDDVPGEDHHDSDVNSYDEHSCTICFAPLEEGDRIGDLRCKHEFHVDCLKTWVQRKNACPLCNVPIGSRKDPQDESEVEQEQQSRDRNGQRRRRRPLLGGGNLSRLPPENRRIGISGVSMVVENDRVDPERTSMDNDHTTEGR